MSHPPSPSCASPAVSKRNDSGLRRHVWDRNCCVAEWLVFVGMNVRLASAHCSAVLWSASPLHWF